MLVLDGDLSAKQTLHVPTPVTPATQSCHKRLIIGQVMQSHLPELNLCSLTHPEMHHLLVQGINIPMLLMGYALRPTEQIVQLKRSKSSHPQSTVAIQFIQTKWIAKTKDMQPDH